jgi:hypothetical protein
MTASAPPCRTRSTCSAAWLGRQQRGPLDAAGARGAAAKHAPAGAGRGGANLPGCARWTPSARWCARPGRGLPRHAAPDAAPRAGRRHRRARRGARADRGGVDRIRRAGARPPTRRGRTCAGRAGGRLGLQLSALPQRRVVDGLAADSGRRARHGAGAPARRVGGAERRDGRAGARRRRADRLVPGHLADRRRRLRLAGTGRPVQVVGPVLGRGCAAVAADLRRRPARGRRAGRHAQLDGALASYRTQVLTAFREVEDQLSSLRCCTSSRWCRRAP